MAARSIASVLEIVKELEFQTIGTPFQKTIYTSRGAVRRWYAKFLCHCGSQFECWVNEVRNGKRKSCGCLRKAAGATSNKTHGMSKTPVYKVWCGMRKRCYNSNDRLFSHYGGRGIKVCERWGVFENFLADMGDRPHGMSIDRIDVNGDYCPENCRWATIKEQSRNRTDNKKVTANGKTMLLVEWAEHLGVDLGLISRRILDGWTDQEAINGHRDGRTPYSRTEKRMAASRRRSHVKH